MVTIGLPQLNKRSADIPLLVDYFLPRFANELGINNPGITKEAERVLVSYPWPGNVRELANILKKVLIFNRGTPIGMDDITQAISGKMALKEDIRSGTDSEIISWIREELSTKNKGNVFDSCMDHFAGVLIKEALNITGGNRTKAAKLLGLSRPTLHSRIEKYQITLETAVKDD